jgi:para-aminobenzoate synthetase component 1
MTLTHSKTETKKPIADNIVRHCLVSVSAKTSIVLRYFVHAIFEREPRHNSTAGLVYFAGNTIITKPIQTPPMIPNIEFNTLEINNIDSKNDVITLFPKVFLAAYITLDGIQIIRSERTDQGRYTHIAKQSNATDYFAELKAISLYTDHPDTSHPNKSTQFIGGLAGFIGYDLAAYQHIDTPNRDHIQPERLVAAMGDYDIYLKRETEGWALYGPNDPALDSLYQGIIATLHTIAAETALTALNHTNSNPTVFQLLKPFTPTWSVDEYQSAFKRIQDYLRAGDCYQVNLTQPFVAQVKGDLLAILDDLLQLTQAPYSGYMRVGEHELLSCSPELFLSFSGTQADGHNQVITRPIKGTRPRSSNTEHDEMERKALTHSEKDQSENLMIVDLLRHDLSRHAVVGSVKVPALFELESFAQVHHLVSEVRATLRQDVSALDVLIDALPGGSITGAPKIRAMQIIDELEAMPRGAYCGSMGYLNRDGSGQFNVLIRTLQKYQDTLVAWAGGGITIASDVDAEYQECLDKISAILNCVNGFGKV